jgi:hypothetical protein
MFLAPVAHGLMARSSFTLVVPRYRRRRRPWGVASLGRARRRAWLAACLGVAMTIAGCASAPPPTPYPHEQVLTVFAELKLYLDQDPYRLAPGRDLQGRNIFRVTLERLDGLGEATGPAGADVFQYARGLCLERLGDWSGAAQAFGRAAQAGTSLAGAAGDHAGAARRMADLVDRDRLSRATPESYLNDLEVMDGRLMEWAGAPNPVSPYAAYARMEAEREREERIAMLFDHRRQLSDGVARAMKLAESLVADFRDSRRVGEHWLLLGSLAEGLARDWARQYPPEGPTGAYGDQGRWFQWVEQARTAYRKAAQADGDPAKPEGAARLRALDAWAGRVASLAR